MYVLQWLAIFLAVPSTWLDKSRRFPLALLTLGYGAALVDGQVGAKALYALVLLLVAAYGVAPARPPVVRYAGHALFFVLAIALGMHALPGFSNPRVIDAQCFTADALPYTMYLNLDKPLAAFWLMLVLPWVRGPQGPGAALRAGAGAALASSAVCMSLAVLLGTVAWAPKAPTVGWLWLLNNLLIVSFTEEAFFRGYVQGGLSRLLASRRHGAHLALGGAALLFGLTHFGGGWQWVVLAGVAGLGYGLAYRFGGLRAAILAHFGLNTVHFFCFTYPMLKPAKVVALVC